MLEHWVKWSQFWTLLSTTVSDCVFYEFSKRRRPVPIASSHFTLITKGNVSMCDFKGLLAMGKLIAVVSNTGKPFSSITKYKTLQKNSLWNLHITANNQNEVKCSKTWGTAIKKGNASIGLRTSVFWTAFFFLSQWSVLYYATLCHAVLLYATCHKCLEVWDSFPLLKTPEFGRFYPQPKLKWHDLNVSTLSKLVKKGGLLTQNRAGRQCKLSMRDVCDISLPTNASPKQRLTPQERATLSNLYILFPVSVLLSKTQPLCVWWLRRMCSEAPSDFFFSYLQLCATPPGFIPQQAQ